MSPKRRRVGRGGGGYGGGEGRGGGGGDGGDGGRGGGYGGGGGRGAESSPARVLKRRCRSFDLEIRGCACCRHHQELHESSVQSLQNSFEQFKQEMREMITSLVNRLPDPRERVEQSCCQPPCYKLIFENSMNDEIFTTREVQAADGDHIKVRMVSSSQQDSNFLPRLLSTATVKIVVLDGDFNADNHDVWASEDFEDHVVRPRDKHGVVLTGKLVVKLENGEGCLHNVTFVDNSKFTRSGKFRLGVKIIGDVGEQVQEGISEPFTVKHRRGEAHKKSVIPSADDELWRLNGIGKNGISQKLLEQNGIFSVKDFLRRYHKDENALRNILNAPSAWTTIVGHAKKCDPGSALYSHFVEDKNIRLYFSSLGHIVGASVAGQYTDFGDLDPFLKVQVEESSKDAYDCVTYHQPDYEMYSSQPRPINRSTLQGSIMPGPKSTESTDQVMHEADEQGTSNGHGFSGSDCQNSAFEEPGSVQVRTIPTVPENDETDATIDIQLESRPEIQYETLNPNCHTGSGSMHSTTAAEEITESVAQNQGALLMHQENYQMDYANDGLSLGHWYSEEQVASQYAYPFSPSMEADLPVYSAPGSFSMDEMFDYITMDDNPHFFAPIASEQPANVHCGITKLPSCRRWVKLNVLLRWKAKLRASKRAKASAVEQEG